MAGKRKAKIPSKKVDAEKRLKELEKRLKVVEDELAKKAEELKAITKKEKEAVVKYAKKEPEKALAMAFLLGLLVGLLKR